MENKIRNSIANNAGTKPLDISSFVMNAEIRIIANNKVNIENSWLMTVFL